MPTAQYLSLSDWQVLANSDQIEDISQLLPDEFLMFNQWMRALIRYQGRVWLAIGFLSPKGEGWVELTVTTEYGV